MNKQPERWRSKATRLTYFVTEEANGNVTITHHKCGTRRTISRLTLVRNYRRLTK
jgi:hypothetical protein|uniref:Uncharacterized protein n=1 Tax=Siphoviridae sp. ctFRY1 TaxID=2827820 RepID=A0A8S5STL5_9CAUD|nr:MAG TPA: hypothetical protein [Siphoviridae sp. ctFRY1]